MPKPAQVIDLPSAAPKTPTIENGKVVPPRRRRNAELRAREYLTPQEAETLIHAAGQTGRHRHRDRTLLLMMYRHGLRVSEAVALRWDMVDLAQGQLHVQRVKNGVPSVHPLRGPQIRALRRLKRDYPETPYVFTTERGGPLTTSAVRKMIGRAGLQAERALRAVALGRKNYLFNGSDAGGDRAAAMYTLLGTAKLNGVDPEAYLRYVIERIAEHPINRVEELLPWNVADQLVSQDLRSA
jgi:integrase